MSMTTPVSGSISVFVPQSFWNALFLIDTGGAAAGAQPPFWIVRRGTVIYIHVRYYGWRYAAYLSIVLYIYMVAAGVTVHLLVRFGIDYTFWLNMLFAAIGGALLLLHWRGRRTAGVRATPTRKK